MLLEGGTSHQGSTSDGILSLWTIGVYKLIVLIDAMKIVEAIHKVGWVRFPFYSNSKVEPNSWLLMSKLDYLVPDPQLVA